MDTNYRFLSYRLTLEMSQRQLAKALGMSRTTVGGYERGEHPVPKYIELALKALWHRLEPDP